MPAYYNEIDPYAAQWLRNLIAAGHIAPGDVDERSIVDVRGDELAGYDQCHFFAGIGGWSLALRLAGWPDDRPVWTGSCPCQPFSAAGKGKAADDERHLWPAWFRLIRECRPATIFGEQVASAAVVGLAGAEAALCDGEPEEEQSLRIGAPCAGESEEEGFSFRSGQLFDGDSEANRQRFVRGDGIAAQLGGWPHLGQPLAGSDRTEGAVSLLEYSHRLSRHQQCDGGLGRAESSPISVGNFSGEEAEIRRVLEKAAREFGPTVEWPWLDLIQSDLEGAGYSIGAAVLPACGVGAPHIRARAWFVANAGLPSGRAEQRDEPRRSMGRDEAPTNGTGLGGIREIPRQGARIGLARDRVATSGVGNACSPRLQERERDGQFQRDALGASEGQAAVGGSDAGCLGDTDSEREGSQRGICSGPTVERTRGAWSDLDWLPCTDGKARPVEPGTFPLAHGISFKLGSGGALEGKSRVGMLRAYGNAIVPQTAAAFITAVMEVRDAAKPS